MKNKGRRRFIRFAKARLCMYRGKDGHMCSRDAIKDAYLCTKHGGPDDAGRDNRLRAAIAVADM